MLVIAVIKSVTCTNYQKSITRNDFEKSSPEKNYLCYLVILDILMIFRQLRYVEIYMLINHELGFAVSLQIIRYGFLGISKNNNEY